MNKARKTIATIALLFISSGLVFAKSNSGTKHKMYLGQGIAHPDFLGTGNGLGAIYADGVNIAGTYRKAGNSTSTQTAFFGGYGNGEAGIMLGQAQTTAGDTTTSSDLLYSAGIVVSDFGFGLRNDELGFIWGPQQSARFGFTYNTESEKMGLGFGMDADRIAFTIDYTTYTASTNEYSTIGFGLGYFGDSFFMGVNAGSTTVKTGSTSTDSSSHALFVGYAASNFTVRFELQPESEAGADDAISRVLLGANF